MKFSITLVNVMINKVHKIAFIAIIICSIIANQACNINEPHNQNKETEEKKQRKEILINTNKYLVKKDNEIISNYIKRTGWKMNQTKSGLWYEIYEHGGGDSVKEQKIISLKYVVSLLDGTPCYNSDSLGLKTFRVGQGGVESGLEEAVLHLAKGDKARLILQPFQAHGLIGDNNKIPARSIIIYDLEVVDIK